ncbi:MAG: phosphatidate cytidylyltransferase [Steroidobacteraceae bacterium]
MASGLRQRVFTALALAAVVLGVLLAMPPLAAVAVVAVIVVLGGAWEWAGFAGWTGPAGRGAYAAAIAALAALAWHWTSDPAHLATFLRATAAWWAVGLLWVLVAPGRGGRPAAAISGVAVLVPAAIGLARTALVVPYGQALLLFLIILIAAADVGAYFGGRLFGRHKLAPAVSPGKTWEGFVAGMLAAAAAAACGAALFDVPVAPWLAVCIPVALVSVVGDLVESMWKRRAGLKDSGGLLPGHGGVLDRIDSLTAAGPAFLLGLQAIGVAA